MKTIILFFSLIICLFSCNNDDDDVDDSLMFQPMEISFVEIIKGDLNGNGDENISESNIIINDDTDWQNLIAQIDTVNQESNSFSETSIDFTNFTVIAIFLDVKPTSWEVEITNIIEDETTMTVKSQDMASDISTITQPYYIAKIPKTNKEFIFISQ